MTMQLSRTRKTTSLLAGLALIGAFAVGCGDSTDEPPEAPPPIGGPGDEEPTEEPPTDPPEATDEPTNGTEEEPVPPNPPLNADDLPLGEVSDEVASEQRVQDAVTDLSERLEVPEEEIALAGFASVQWNDGSIGCPKPGEMYTQAIVPGYQLILESQDTYFSYHAAGEDEFNYCADPMLPTYDDRM